jgi:hypothetical protein
MKGRIRLHETRTDFMKQEPELTIDMGKLDWLPAERARARHIADTAQHANIRQQIADRHRRAGQNDNR